MRAQGSELANADEALLLAHAIKLPIDVPYYREAMDRNNAAVSRLERKAEPDKNESEVWAELHYSLMAKEGQYVSTRLFQSGEHTYPYFQEAGDRPLAPGDLLCLDTDAIAFENCAWISLVPFCAVMARPRPISGCCMDGPVIS